MTPNTSITDFHAAAELEKLAVGKSVKITTTALAGRFTVVHAGWFKTLREDKRTPLTWPLMDDPHVNPWFAVRGAVLEDSTGTIHTLGQSIAAILQIPADTTPHTWGPEFVRK